MKSLIVAAADVLQRATKRATASIVVRAGRPAFLRPVLAVATTTIVASGCALPFGGDSDIDSSTASAEVAELLESILERPGASTDVELETCPYDTDGSLLAEAVSGLDSPDVDRSLADGSIPTSSVNAIDGGFVLCLRFDPDSFSAIGMDVSSAPDDFESYLQDYLDPFDEYADGSTESLAVERSATEHRGGTLHQICVNYPKDPEGNFCEVDWLSDDLLVAVYVTGPQTINLDVAALEQGLANVLPEIVSNVETIGTAAVES